MNGIIFRDQKSLKFSPWCQVISENRNMGIENDDKKDENKDQELW